VVIRDVVLHVNGEQPMRADLFEFPEADAVLLRCTNLRTLNNTRPVFVDDLNSIFFFPMLHLRFIEVLPKSQAEANLALAPGETPIPMYAPPQAPPEPEPEEDLEIDEDFLRKVREA
jgi:hypothetical protein